MNYALIYCPVNLYKIKNELLSFSMMQSTLYLNISMPVDFSKVIGSFYSLNFTIEPSSQWNFTSINFNKSVHVQVLANNSDNLMVLITYTDYKGIYGFKSLLKSTLFVRHNSIRQSTKL